MAQRSTGDQETLVIVFWQVVFCHRPMELLECYERSKLYPFISNILAPPDQVVWPCWVLQDTAADLGYLTMLTHSQIPPDFLTVWRRWPNNCFRETLLLSNITQFLPVT